MDYSILKYQFPPPGSMLLNTNRSEFDDSLSIRALRLSIVWEYDIPLGSALVLSQVRAGVMSIDTTVRTTGAQFTAFKKSVSLHLFYNLAEANIARAVGYLPIIKYPSDDFDKHTVIFKPLPIVFESNAENQNKAELGKFIGPFVFGGPRKIALAAYAERGTGLPDYLIAVIAGSVSGWLITDQDQEWRNSFK